MMSENVTSESMTDENATSGGRAPLSVEAAFVVHVTASRQEVPEALHGRVEHVASGQSRRFRSVEGLVTFMHGVLGQTIDDPAHETDGSGSRRTAPGKAPVALLTAILLGCAMFAARAEAQVTILPINKCLAGKISGVGKSLAAHGRCLAKETSRGIEDPGCHQKASDKFTGGTDPAKGLFHKLEAKFPIDAAAPCRTFLDQASLEISITDNAFGVSDITGSGAGRCDAAKIKCAGKYVAAVAKCAAKAAGTSAMIDSACIGAAMTRLSGSAGGCLDKAALATDCTHAESQAAALQLAADMFLQDALCALDPGNAGCALTTTTLDTSTTTSTTIPPDTTTTTVTTSTTIPLETTTTTETTSTTLPGCTPVLAPPALTAGTFILLTRGEEQHTGNVDPSGYGDPELNAISNSDPVLFDASNFIDPAVCDSTADDLTFHWEIRYPPAATINNPYTVAGITGYRKVRLEIGSNTLIAQAVPPVDFRLVVTSKATGLSTTVEILSQVSESSLTLTVYNSCKGQAVACDECICTIAAALPTTEPT